MFLLLFFIFPLISADCPDGTLEYPFVPPSKCYSFIATKSTFSSAEASCNKVGGSLTSIHDAFTNSFLKEEASLLFSDTSDFWIGASRSSNGSSWTWSDKSPFDFTDWKNGSTNNGANFASMNTANGMWITADGNSQKPFVCAVITNSTVPTTTTPTTPVASCPDDWYFFEGTNSCYFASDSVTWEKGEEYCVSQGGHLASIHSGAERDFGLSVYHGTLWIGLYTNETNITRHTTWKWTDGSEVDFLPWYYPYFATFIPSCIQLSGASKFPVFLSANCTDKYYGLCKRPAVTLPPPTTTVSTTPQTDASCLSGWKFFEVTNSCYITGQFDSWPAAEQYCIFIDAHLASIHSLEELNFVRNIRGGWIGLYSDNNGISWKWVDDTPFDYRNWVINNPTRGGNLCGNVDGYGYANDEHCSYSDTSVCKRAAFKK